MLGEGGGRGGRRYQEGGGGGMRGERRVVFVASYRGEERGVKKGCIGVTGGMGWVKGQVF